MGLVASQARNLLLTGRKSDIELRCQMISNKRMRLSFETGEVAQAYADALSNTVPIGAVSWPTPPGQPAASQTNTRLYTEDDAAATAIYEAQTTILQAEDKRLELELKNLETQHKAISTEMDAVQKVIEKNIEKSFKTLG
jgi:hypothetical protein